MRWTLRPISEQDKVARLAKALTVDLTIARLLVNRGIDTFEKARIFFRPSLNDLHDPFLMKDMDLAVQRIEVAIANNENILVFGDYDVDGTTAVALMSTYLKELHPNVATYVPDRYEEGYGVSLKGIDFAADNEISLIIALDCGIKAVEKVDYAKKLGIDFIICDHHTPGNTIPAAVAVLDPKQSDCHYPYKELCGCGVGFKLIQALGTKYGQGIDDLVAYLDLVAIAIGADIVPMTGENRILTYFGLQVINGSPRTGIRAMKQGIEKPKLNITDVVFILAPRINAAGRLHHGNLAVSLLTETDEVVAKERAAALDKNNNERKQLDKTITDEALQQIEENNEQQKFSTVVFAENWHKGVIGIVASRLIETYYRPTVVFTESGDKLAASARSVKGFDVYAALEKCSAFIEQFGGHKYAAGLTIKKEHYSRFKSCFEAVVKESIPEILRTPEVLIDGEVQLEDLTPKFYRIINQFAPFGPQNMKPIFVATGLRDNGYGKRVGADKSHLKLSVFQASTQITMNAIGFGMGDKMSAIEKSTTFQAAFTLDENTWNGRTSLQLVLKDIKV